MDINNLIEYWANQYSLRISIYSTQWSVELILEFNLNFSFSKLKLILGDLSYNLSEENLEKNLLVK